MLLLMPIVAPLVLALLVAWPRTRTVAMAMAPWAALPGLGVAAFGPADAAATADWLLLGARLALDDLARVVLLFTATLWVAAGAFARRYLAGDPRRARFVAWFLVTLAGNLGLVLAADMLTFYVCFAVMSFAAYPLVVHTGDPAAVQAARIYIVLVIAGELLLFTGIMATAAIAGRVDLLGAPAAVAAAPMGPLVMSLLLAGFGIKAGALPLHVWLPLAHPAAPTPASAVLSGALIKAGLVGWLRFLPMGEVALPALGAGCVGAGLLAAFAGVAAGLTQTNAKSALAYSSISQMGFLTAGLGVGLLAPEAWPMLLPAVLLYAAHHGLAKGALFLGVGVAGAAAGAPARHRRLVAAGLLVPALALAGAPLTSGAAAKLALKHGLGELGAAAPWAGSLDLWLTLAAVGTTLLMARVLYLLASDEGATHGHLSTGLVAPWAVLVMVVAVMAWMPGLAFLPMSAAALTSASLWAAVWPVAAGGGVAWFAWSAPAAASWRARLHVPAGDLVWPVMAGWERVVRVATATPWGAVAQAARDAAARARWPRVGLPAAAARLEQGLMEWTTAGVLLVLMTVIFVFLLVR